MTVRPPADVLIALVVAAAWTPASSWMISPDTFWLAEGVAHGRRV